MNILKSLVLGLSFCGTMVAHVEYTNDPNTIPTNNFATIDQIAGQLLPGMVVPTWKKGDFGFDQYYEKPSEAVPLTCYHWVFRADYLKVMDTIKCLYLNRRDLLDCFLWYYDLTCYTSFDKLYIKGEDIYKSAHHSRLTPPELLGPSKPAMELTGLGLLEQTAYSREVRIPQVVWYILMQLVTLDGGKELVVTFSDPVLRNGDSLKRSIKRKIDSGIIKAVGG